MSLRVDSPAELARLMGTDYEVSEQQWAAITAPLAPCVVLAGAGSGKTTLMAARVVYLVATGQVLPDEVLGLTFTTKAAAQLGTVVGAALDRAGLTQPPGEVDPGVEDEPQPPTIATYNAYAASLLREHGLRIGFEPDTRVLADATRFQLAEEVVRRHTNRVDQLSEHLPTVVGYVLDLDTQMSEHLVGADAVRSYDAEQRELFRRAYEQERAGQNRSSYYGPSEKGMSAIDRRRELLGLVEDYRRAKQERGLMDFAEQIELAAQLADGHTDVGATERAAFRVVLLDEYQDTSVAQARMLSALFSGPTPAGGRGHAVTAVGDPNQAIYGWRGASVANLVRFGESFPHADSGDVPILPLSVSRRSAPLILDVANAVARPLYDALHTVRPLDPAPGASGGQVEVVVHETIDEELASLAHEVRAAHDDPEAVADGRAWSDIGVLTRDNAHGALVYSALADAGIPVEIVGLNGLLRLPEVAEVVSVLRLVHDVTANSALLALLSGPRWAVGPRDLALLGHRASDLAREGEADRAEGLQDELEMAVRGADVADLAVLGDALDDPGEAPYSPEARERFALLAGEIRALRAHVGEPLLDLVRRVVDVTGIDVELASSLSASAASRRDNLDAFVGVVAGFRGTDGETSLTALLAYLQAEDELAGGLAVATPSASDSVKLLTVHRAKGLEWHTVFVAGVCHKKFPPERGRALWISTPSQLPTALRGDADDQPELLGHDRAGVEDYRRRVKDAERTEELRLAYVAVTRPARRLRLSSYVWGDGSTPLGPGDVQRTVAEVLAARELPVPVWPEQPARGTPNPRLERDTSVAWPRAVSDEAAVRLRAAERVRRAAEAIADGVPEASPTDLQSLARLDDWDAEIDRLVAEARASRPARVEVPLPDSLSTTALARLRDDPAAFARDLARPMPRQPSSAARFGTRFHAWVEQRFGQQGLIDLDDIPGRADVGIDDDDDLRTLIRTFEAGPFGSRPPYRLEQAFALVLAHEGVRQVVRGRIDAVYATECDEPGKWLLVDWKTGREDSADPLQLAVYRVAWAELIGCDPDEVTAAFSFVRSGRTVVPEDLPGRAQIAALVVASSTAR